MPSSTLEAVSAARWRIAISLTVSMMAVYFGFLLLVAFNKPLLGSLVTRGLSLGMLLGALVIVVAWVLTWIYVRWANTHYDAALEGLRTSPDSRARASSLAATAPPREGR